MTVYGDLGSRTSKCLLVISALASYGVRPAESTEAQAHWVPQCGRCFADFVVNNAGPGPGYVLAAPAQ